MTKFPLTGAHVNTQCTQCHTSGQFVGLSTQCVSCHLTNFQQTTNPNHATAGIPQTCVQCHNTTTWGDGKVRPLQDGVPAHGSAHHRAMHAVPRGRQLRGHAHAVLGLPSCHVPEDDQPEPRDGRVPANLRAVPHHRVMADLDVSITIQRKFPLTGAHTTVRARNVTSAASLPERRCNARPAISRPSSRPRIRTTFRPASPRTARCATAR